jgi:hypothetical protein
MARIVYERETTIVFNDEEDHATIWSDQPIFQRHMARLGVEPYRTVSDGSDGEGRWYRVPKSWVRVRPPRQISDEQRERIMTDHLREYRFSAETPPEDREI